MSTGALEFLLALQEECGGAIPFDRWMREALYHPRFGYYTANIRGVGRGGDFSTWATLQDSLGLAIARWLKANRPGGKWHVIEVGGGSGQLAKSVFRHLGWWNKPAYHIVDISPVLRDQQRALLKGVPVQWHEEIGSALAAANGKALIFSNELADAFPCRILRKRAGGWEELRLRIDGGRWIETWASIDAPDSSVANEEWPENQRVETPESFRGWLASWLPEWREGAMLTIDYGDHCPALYHRRPRGTIRAFAHHQRLEGAEAYAAFGKRDITFDINFTDLANWGGDLGLRTIGDETLGDFLKSQGVTASLGEEAGEAFRVLVQRTAN